MGHDAKLMFYLKTLIKIVLMTLIQIECYRRLILLPCTTHLTIFVFLNILLKQFSTLIIIIIKCNIDKVTNA